jgi:predicted component of type VI protein secretion system
MARPRKENREEVASVAFNLRITLAEKHAIDRLVLHQEEQLRGMGIVAKASAASLVRTWIHAETKRTFGAFPLADEPQPDLPLELEVPMPKPLDTAARKAPADPTPPPKAEPMLSAEPPTADAVRKRVARALEGKHKCFDSAADLARTAGVTATDVGRLRAGRGLTQPKLVAIDAALAGRGA